MSEINYNTLSNEQLIALLQSKDKELEEQEEKYEELAEAFGNFSAEVFYNPEIDQFNLNSPDDINFSDLIVSGEEVDNSSEVSRAESSYDENKSNHEAIIESVYEARKNLFTFAVNSWIEKRKIGIEPHFMDSSAGIYDRLDFDYNDYNFVDKELSKLVKYETTENFISIFGIPRTLYIFSHAYNRLPEKDEEANENIKGKIEKFIKIAMAKEPLKISYSVYTTFEEKEAFLNKYFTGSDFLIINKVKKERELLNQIIEEQPLTATTKRRMWLHNKF